MGDDVDVRLVLHLAEFGSQFSADMAEIATEGLMTDNASLITLASLHLEGPQQPGDLVTRTRLTSGGVTRLLQRLEEAGVVERHRGTIPEDGRAVEVTITDRGTTFLREAVAIFRGHRAAIEEFSRLTLDLLASLDRDPGGGAGGA